MGSTRSPVQVTTVSGGLSRRMALACLGGGTAALLATARPDRSQAQATPPPRGRGGRGAEPLRAQRYGDPAHLRRGHRSRRATVDLRRPVRQSHRRGGRDRVEESALGQLVTGRLGAFPDQGELWLTLLLPRFNPMSSADPPTPFATLAILKWVISTIAGPPRTGALDEYRVLPLAGTARLVLI